MDGFANVDILPVRKEAYSQPASGASRWTFVGAGRRFGEEQENQSRQQYEHAEGTGLSAQFK